MKFEVKKKNCTYCILEVTILIWKSEHITKTV